MSNGSPPITPAPSPPSAPGIVQPVIVEGGESLPPSFPLGTAGTWLPPPQVGFGGNAPFPTPVVEPAAVPPSVAGYPQPQFATGSGTTPTAAALFPAFTAPGPSPPIIYSAVQPPPPVPLPLPTTPGTQPITISTAPNIPQLPWTGLLAAADEPAPVALSAEVPDPPPPAPKRSHHSKAKSRARQRH